MIKNATIRPRKRIALIAHDNKKADMLEWAKYNVGTLQKHILYATGTTGVMLEKELGLEINVLESVHWAATCRLAHASRTAKSIS